MSNMHLERCPFCLANAALYQPTYGEGYFAAMCENCDAEGPLGADEEKAAAGWNRRNNKQYMLGSPVMSIVIHVISKSVEFRTDISVPTYGEWIPGEGGDVCLLRNADTGKVVGCDLPLTIEYLSVYRID